VGAEVNERVPAHLAIIPDGNRRWARASGLSVADGHAAGIVNVGRIADAAFAAGVEVVSFWWGSPANLTKRSPDEVRSIVGVLDEWLSRAGVELLRAADARFDAFGRIDELCPSLSPAIERARAVAPNGSRRLVLLMAYDGRDELLDAVRRSGGDPSRFEAALWTASLPAVDLLLRTGAEPHFSAGFLLWHLAESQIAFRDETWPAFGRTQLDDVLARFAHAERRFGA
jgi:undecaprenyl diphosphate synthase